MIRLLVVILATFSLCGCSPRTYVPLESTQRDSIATISEESVARIKEAVEKSIQSTYINKETHTKDSTIIILNQAGEIVSREVVKYVDREISEKEISTLLLISIDSIINDRFQQMVASMERDTQTAVEVQARLTLWQRIKQSAGTIAILLLCATTIFVFAKWRY